MLRRRTAPREALTDGIRRLLETGEAYALEPHEHLRLRRLGRNEATLRELWAEHRDAVLRDWIRQRPGTRPAAWWRVDAPEKRRRLGGIGTPAHEVVAYATAYRFGIPARWIDIDSNDPPRFESESAFLERHGLLSAAERLHLPADAFEDEFVNLSPGEGRA